MARASDERDVARQPQNFADAHILDTRADHLYIHTGTWLHNSLLPPTLHEGAAPTEQEVTAHDKSLFAPRLSSESFNEEWYVLLDNLAWCCTYGKKNCITTAMYSQDEPLSLGKISRITWSKVSEGVFRC